MPRTSSSKLRTLLLASGALILAGIGGYTVARLSTSAPTAPAPAAEAEKKPAAHEGEGAVQMTPERIRLAGIRLVPANRGPLSAEISVQGVVSPQPEGEAVLAARADGVVVRINRRLGDAVGPGEAIATIESRDASAIAADRASASARAIAANQVFERERRLFDAGISPRQDLEAAQATRAQANAEVQRARSAAAAARVSADGRTIAVVSPIGGRVTAAPAVLGSYVTAGAELFRVADASRIEVRAAVPAADSQRIAPGDTALVETSTGTVSATVRSITPSLDVESRAATVVLTLTGSSPLRPGQAVRVRITPATAGGAQNVFVVPEEAVQSVEGRDVVFLRTAQGFQATPVTVGARGSGRAEILSGLSQGQQLAGQGAFILKAELGKNEASHDD